MRESGLGATAIRIDGHHNFEGWEDGAVPPDQLAEYLRGITALWAKFGYSGAWYGHFGQGCVHTRNNFDLVTPEGLRNYRSYVTAAAELVVSLGGSLSGEHGDGQSRGELLATMFGPELVAGVRRVQGPLGPRRPHEPRESGRPLPSRFEHPLLDAQRTGQPAPDRVLLRQGRWFADARLLCAA